MASTRAVVLSVLSVACVPFLGCNEPETDTDSNVLANVETTVKPEWSPPLSGGTCPDPSVEPQWYQGKATAAFGYVVGGNNPIRSDEIIKNPECKASYECTTLLRNLVADPKSGATLIAAGGGTVCGLKASLYRIEFSQEVSAATWDQVRSCGLRLDGCWGVGVSGFFYADPSQDRIRRIYIDPEPARLTADLFGGTGATAAAVYTNTGTNTSVLKWPGSYVASATPPLAGTPCSTADLLAGVDTYKVIQASGSWRRCY